MRAIVLGNIGLDETFRVATFPAPGETRLADARPVDLGGKGANQAVILARCGVPTKLVARIGRDETAGRLRALLAAEPLDASHMIATDEPTDRSIILTAQSGENMIISTSDCAGRFTVGDTETALSDAGTDDLLLLQGNLTVTVTRHALQAARRRGLRTVFNPAPVAAGFAALWPQVDIAVLNRLEARLLSGCGGDPADAARQIRAAGASSVIVTLGGDGAVLCDGAGLIRQPAVAANVVDTTGAGDTFVAVLVAGMFARGYPRELAMRLAAAAAAVTIGRAGTLASFPTATELAAILARTT